ncbi:MAG: hypothetical protein KF841_09205 [Phycisphaerae bacterium]|nr:hypothetical protein [Phycisphaerae bacterium]
MKRYVGFSDTDAQLLHELQAPMRPFLAEIVDHFYEVLNRDPRAKSVLDATASQTANLRISLNDWLNDLFCGQYDMDYFNHRTAIGRTHVRVKLPQVFMFTAMSVLRLDLTNRLSRLDLPDLAARIAAVHKLLDLELAIMNETYSNHLLSLMREVEHQAYEQKLSESEHLATIGQLAASLAHEIKNPLAGISGAIQVLGSSLDDGHPHREVILEVLRQIDRLDSAVKDLLIYARPRAPTKLPVNLGKLVERVMLLFREEPSFRAVNLICHGLDSDIIGDVDEMQIDQVVYNLLLNAAHACDSSGGIVACKLQRTADRALIVVEDNGIGIPKPVLARVFEPFFTTKAKGTGLGLPICKRIVELHGGTLRIESEVGRGTRVTVELPSRT